MTTIAPAMQHGHANQCIGVNFYMMQTESFVSHGNVDAVCCEQCPQRSVGSSRDETCYLFALEGLGHSEAVEGQDPVAAPFRYDIGGTHGDKTHCLRPKGGMVRT